MALALLVFTGCQGGVIGGGGALTAPTVNDVPSQVSQSDLVVTGGQQPGLLVWVQLQGEPDARAAISGSTGDTWSITLPLQLGANRFVVFATDAAETSFSPQVGPFDVEYVSVVAAPTLDPVISPTSEPVQTLTGTKPAGTSLHLTRQGGSEVQIVAAGSTTAWSYDLDLDEGANTFTIVARAPDEPQTSPGVTETIVLDTTPPTAPVLSTGDTVTGAATITLEGSRAPDGDLCLRRDQEPQCLEVAPIDGDTSIDLDVPLGNGANFLCLSSSDELGNASAETCITVTRVGAPAITIEEPTAGQALLQTTVDVVATITSADSPLDEATIEICLNGTSACVSGAALGFPNVYGATLDLSGQAGGTTQQIIVQASNDAGVSGSASVNVLYNAGATVLTSNTTPGHSTGPALAQVSGQLHVVWADECAQFICDVTAASGNLPWDVFYRTTVGGTWGPIELVSNGGGQQSNDGDSGSPTIAADSAGNVHVVWVESGNVLGSGSDRDLVHRVRDAGSGTFGATTLITVNTEDDTAPALAAGSDGSVHLAWVRATGSDRDVYYSRWTSPGGWSAALLLSDDANDGLESVLPAIAVDGDGNAHVVWQDNGDVASSGTDRDILYRKVTSGVAGGIVLVTDNGQDNNLASASRAPAIAIRGDSVVIAWEESANILVSGTDIDIFLRVYDRAQTPQAAAGQYTLVSSNSAASSVSAALGFTAAGDIVVAWAEGDGTAADIVYSVSQAGYFFSTTTPWATAASLSSSPALTLDTADNVHLIWEDLSTPPGFTNDPPRPDAGGVPNPADPDLDLLYTASPP